MKLLVFDERVWVLPRGRANARVNDNDRFRVFGRTLASVSLRTTRVTDNLYTAVGRRIAR